MQTEATWASSQGQVGFERWNYFHVVGGVYSVLIGLLPHGGSCPRMMVQRPVREDAQMRTTNQTWKSQ
jgi:hypothetical protein